MYFRFSNFALKEYLLPASCPAGGSAAKSRRRGCGWVSAPVRRRFREAGQRDWDEEGLGLFVFFLLIPFALELFRGMGRFLFSLFAIIFLSLFPGCGLMLNFYFKSERLLPPNVCFSGREPGASVPHVVYLNSTSAWNLTERFSDTLQTHVSINSLEIFIVNNMVNIGTYHRNLNFFHN